MDEDNTFDWNKVSSKNEVDLSPEVSPEEVSQGTEQPKVQQPKVEQPTVQQPKVQQPKVEKPTVQQPKVQQPKVEKPKADVSPGRRSRRKAEEDREALATGQSPVPTQVEDFDPEFPQSEQPAADVVEPVEPVNFEEIFSRKNRKQIQALDKAGFQTQRLAEIITSALQASETEQPRPISNTESLDYIIAKARAAGREPPPMVASHRGGDPQQLSFMEGKALAFNRMERHGTGPKGMDELINLGLGDFYFGKEWVDWYTNEVSQPGLPGWLTDRQEKAIGLVPIDAPTRPKDQPEQYAQMNNPELIEDGHVRSYEMLGQRGRVDVKAAGTKNSTMDVLRAARLMEKKGRTEEEVTAFKRENGVTAIEEDVFNDLVRTELKKMQTEEKTAILSVGKRGDIATLTENVKRREDALAAAKSKPDTATNREIVQGAQDRLDEAKAAYKQAVEVLREEGPGAMAYRLPLTLSAPVVVPDQQVAGAVVRRGEGRAPVQGTLGGTDAAAFEDARRLAEDIVHQKTRLAAAFMVKSNAARRVSAVEAKYPDEQLKRARTYATENFPAVEREWIPIQNSLRTEFNRKAVVVGPDQERQREAKIEKEKAAWYKSKGYTFSKSEGTYLLTEDAIKADQRAAALKKIAQEQAVATEDIKRFKEGLAAMGGSKEDAEGIK